MFAYKPVITYEEKQFLLDMCKALDTAIIEAAKENVGTRKGAGMLELTIKDAEAWSKRIRTIAMKIYIE